jgi:hypothetical protein
MAVYMDKEGMTLYDSNKEDIAFAPLTNGLFTMNISNTSTKPEYGIVAAAVDFNDPVWHEHRRLGHLSLQNMRHLLKISTGMNLTDKQISAKIGDVCPICWTTRNLNRIPREPAKRRFKEPGEMLVLDTWGPYPIYSLKGERWALFITDDATRYTWVTFLTTKDTISTSVIDIFTLLENSLNITIRRVRFDNEFLQTTIQDMARQKGIAIEVSVPYAHHHAGTAERANRAIRERASALIHDQYPPSPTTRLVTNRTEEFLRNSSLPEGLWTYAVQEAVWKKNRSPTRAHKNKKTPFEALKGIKPDVSKEHIWGARVYVTYAPEIRGAKLHGPRGWIGYYLCAESESIYKVWDPEKKQVKRIQSSRVDDTTGMNDVQPGSHINERLPRPQINIPEHWSDNEHDSDSTSENSSSDDDEDPDNSPTQDLPSPPEIIRSHHFGGMVFQRNHPHLETESPTKEDNEIVTSPFFITKTTPQKASTIPAPSQSTILVPASDDDHTQQHDEHSDTWVSESDYEDNQEPTQCTRCVVSRTTCQPLGGDSKCTRCIKYPSKRTGCIPATEEQITNCNNACRTCKTSTARILKCDGNEPCNICTKEGKGLSCVIPKKLTRRPTIAEDDRCGRCQLHPRTNSRRNIKAHHCDGKYPCNVCEDIGKTCIRKELMHRDKCARCADLGIECNREDFCSSCIRKGEKQCTHYEDNNSTKVSYYKHADDVPKKSQQDCSQCRSSNRTCSNSIPCTQCLEKVTLEHGRYATCGKRTAPTVRTTREKAGFLYDRDEWGYIIAETIRPDPEYSGTIHTRKIKNSQYNKEPGDEPEHTALAAYTYTPHNDMTLATEDDRLDGDMLDYLSDNELIRKDDNDGDDLQDDDLFIFAAMAPNAILDIHTPTSYKDAMRLPEATHWHNATQKEIKALTDKGVFTVVTLPSGKKALSTKLVYKLKITPEGEIGSYKARIVARGFLQKKGVDFNESWSPTVRSESVRTLLAICTLLNWFRTQIDIPTAYLNATLHEELYVRPPPPIELPPGQVWKLNKALYGLVQSARAWFHRLKDDVEQLGFRASPYDPCVYAHTSRPILLSVHVDDIGIYALNKETADTFKKDMFKLFHISMEEPEPTYLGMHIIRDEHSTNIHQSGYIRQILHRYKLDTQPRSTTPSDHRVKLQPHDGVSHAGFKIGYLQKFGSANYLPTLTRPDIAYATSLCGRFNANPGQEHLDAIHQIYAYVADTPSLGITYNDDDPKLQGYVDADWAGDQERRKSTTGWVFTLAGGPISWSSKRQSVVALSTCEAEYMAACDAVKEAVWLKRFINDLNIGISFDTVPLHIDNDSTIKLAHNPEFHQRSKHIDIRHHYIRDCIESGDVTIKWIPGTENPADMFTKALSPQLFNICRDRLKMQTLDRANTSPR